MVGRLVKLKRGIFIEGRPTTFKTLNLYFPFLKSKVFFRTPGYGQTVTLS